jgi:hypothetical protein
MMRARIVHPLLLGCALLASGACGKSGGSVVQGRNANQGRGGDASTGGPTVGDAAGTQYTCADLFDQTMLPTYSFEISADNWAKLDADFHDVKDVLAGTPPQTYYPITFHYGSETVTDAAVRLRGKSSWVQTVEFDSNPKMQFTISFDQTNPNGKFHGLSSIHLEIPRDDWTFLNDRVGNNWYRKVGIVAPCSNSARLNVNGSYYGLYITEGPFDADLIRQFYGPGAVGDLFKGGTEPQTNKAAPDWARLTTFDQATDITSLAAIADLSNSVLEWATEAVIEDADGYYGGSHNFYLYDEGAPGYVWLPDHGDSSLEWVEVFTPLGYKEHPIYWWAGRPSPDVPGADYLLVMNDPTWRSHYVDAIATQAAKWDAKEVSGWLDTWSAQIADAVAADPHKWATTAQFQSALAAAHDVVANRAGYLQSFVSCEHGDPASSTDADGDGVAWCNDCDETNPAVHPGAPEICGNHVDDNCNGVADENCPGETPGPPAGAVAADGGISH